MKKETKRFAVILAVLIFMQTACPQTAYSKRLEIELKVYKNDSVDLNKMHLVRGGASLYVSPGSYRLEILNEKGEKIFEENYKLSFIFHSNPPEAKDYSILYLKPGYEPEMRTIKLYNNNNEIFSHEINLCNLNGFCNSKYENYLSCSEDCPLDTADGICIKDYDRVCDPDCAKGVDPDCIVETTTTTSTTETTTTSIQPRESKEDNYLVYIIGLIVLAVVAFIVYSQAKKRKQRQTAKEREEMMEWIESQLRDGEDPEKLKTVVKSQGYEPELVDYIEKKLM